MAFKSVFLFFISLQIVYGFRLVDNGFEYSKCFNIVDGEETFCNAPECVFSEIAYRDFEEFGQQPYCFCRWNTMGPRCMTHRKIIAHDTIPSRLWQPTMNDTTFRYNKRNLIALYLVEDIAQCKDLCQQLNVIRSHDFCGAVVFHRDNGRGICELVWSKPIGFCRNWLEIRPEWSVAYLEQSETNCH